MNRLKTWSCCTLAGLASAIILASCASGGSPLGDQLPPQFGGLPANAPPRSATVAPYPDIHNVPPPRSEPALGESDQLKLEQDLAALRARQQKLQDPKAGERANAANAANAAAMAKARAAATEKAAAGSDVDKANAVGRKKPAVEAAGE